MAFGPPPERPVGGTCREEARHHHPASAMTLVGMRHTPRRGWRFRAGKVQRAESMVAPNLQTFNLAR